MQCTLVDGNLELKHGCQLTPWELSRYWAQKFVVACQGKLLTTSNINTFMQAILGQPLAAVLIRNWTHFVISSAYENGQRVVVEAPHTAQCCRETPLYLRLNVITEAGIIVKVSTLTGGYGHTLAVPGFRYKNPFL